MPSIKQMSPGFLLCAIAGKRLKSQRIPFPRWIHPACGLLTSIRLLTEFKKLKRLEFRGDPFLSDEKFVELGKLEQIKSLRLRLL
jgi:hypothetical protein